MKILIWFLCIFVNALITTLIKESGFILGAIPTIILFSATIWLARTLCKKWDEHKEYKELIKYASTHKPQPVPCSEWQCSCGRVHPKYETSCICGKSKFDNLSHPKTEEMSRKAPVTSDQILFCRKCGEKLIDGSKFCGKCGTEILKE